MSSATWWSGIARVFLVTAGLLGLFLAADTIFLALLILVGAVLGGDLNPYTGLFLFIVVPALVAIGAGVAWVAYRLWRSLSRQAPVEVERLVLRT